MAWIFKIRALGAMLICWKAPINVAGLLQLEFSKKKKNVFRRESSFIRTKQHQFILLEIMSIQPSTLVLWNILLWIQVFKFEWAVVLPCPIVAKIK